jgi:photosystem II stability/assembly factor-like uncharacterized protein
MLMCWLSLFALASPMWVVLTSGIDSNLRGVSVSRENGAKQTAIVWAAGSRGVILRSADGGKTWDRLHIPEGDSLDFRGVQVFGENLAYVMSSGEGEKSRIYKTTDAGKTWKLQYSDARKEFFLDAMVCISPTHCFALSDPVDGKFLLARTEDGERWRVIPAGGMPPALPGEGAFAASNSCLLAYGGGDLYFVTGGPAARVFHSHDEGRNWSVTETALLSGKASAGGFSVARSGKILVVMGGDYQLQAQSPKTAAYSRDKGHTWQLAETPPEGYRSAVIAEGQTFVAVGPSGADVSRDGKHWQNAGELNLNAITMGNGQIWGVGEKGVVARMERSEARK